MRTEPRPLELHSAARDIDRRHRRRADCEVELALERAQRNATRRDERDIARSERAYRPRSTPLGVRLDEGFATVTVRALEINPHALRRLTIDAHVE